MIHTHPSAKSTVLIVDDHPNNLDVLITYLDKSDLIIFVARDGEEALELAAQSAPDLILLDVMMPGIDGFETCRRLKQHDATRDIPVIFMTALSMTGDKIKGFEAGGVDYITKPLQHEEVLARVNTHLMIRKLQQDLQEQNQTLEAYATLLKERNMELNAQNAQLDEKNAQLKELNASKDTFFSIIAHDLRNAFSGFLGMIQLIVENIGNYDQEELKKFIGILQNTSKKLYTLLENLLTWARIQQGAIHYAPRALNIQMVVQRNATILSPTAEQKQITLVNAIQEEMLVYGDEEMIDTVVRNLLSNALKFTRSGGTVTVSSRLVEGHVEVTVSDTGIGISEENIAKLFRIDAKYKRVGTAQEQGTGLGLILCKEFVERNNGNIQVESEVGQGTTFRFTLPKLSVE